MTGIGAERQDHKFDNEKKHPDQLQGPSRIAGFLAQLAGAEALPEPLPAAGRWRRYSAAGCSRLPPETRLLLAVAAAEPTVSQAMVWRAAGKLGIDPEAAATADVGGLAEFTPRIEFRHPLIRSVVYHSTPLQQRRRIHQALAAVAAGG